MPALLRCPAFTGWVLSTGDSGPTLHTLGLGSTKSLGCLLGLLCHVNSLAPVSGVLGEETRDLKKTNISKIHLIYSLVICSPPKG